MTVEEASVLTVSQDIARLLEWAMNITARVEPRMHWEAFLSGSRGNCIAYTVRDFRTTFRRFRSSTPQTLINRAVDKLPEVPAAVPQHIGPSLPKPSAASDDDDDDDDNDDEEISDDAWSDGSSDGEGNSAEFPIDMTGNA